MSIIWAVITLLFWNKCKAVDDWAVLGGLLYIGDQIEEAVKKWRD